MYIWYDVICIYIYICIYPSHQLSKQKSKHTTNQPAKQVLSGGIRSSPDNNCDQRRLLLLEVKNWAEKKIGSCRTKSLDIIWLCNIAMEKLPVEIDIDIDNLYS